ncbi:aminotransferase class I/II-fold pyridoxal phosphate-dependent enzyme [bacterium D16-54]|nr:aminotransferase class I/II-fold pyridoxal phosphate-dependent enzyme [bacterium D16-54]RKJ08969.1 aminotransferase class I/II-fold pyridoxal phosphate-dependent enzyme [bacterium D16-56]
MSKEIYIEEIEKFVSEFKEKESISVINLSDWNPSSEFMNKLAINIPYTFAINPISYIFSSDFDQTIKSKIINKWKYKNEKAIIFFNSGSESILNVLYLLFRQNCKKIYLVCPTYFSIEPICQTLHIDCKKIYLERINNIYYLPSNFENDIENNSCLWITNPIYCTGNLYSKNDIDKIKNCVIAKELFLVNDESLCFQDFALTYAFESYENYINIITPHKALCTNALKFSGIILPNKYYDAMDRWSDVLEGCLGAGALVAINHFLSPQFSIYEQSFRDNIEKNRLVILSLIHKYKVDFDMFSKSYLLSLYFDNIAYDYLDNLQQMKNLIYDTNAYIITGSKNNFSPYHGLSFRINLCRVDTAYLYALERVLIYLKYKN